MKFLLFSLAALLLLQTVSPTRTLRPLFTASGAPDKDKTGCYIVVLKQETTHEMFQSILSQVVRMSTDTKVHGSVERVAKAFTVKLSENALNEVRSLPQVDYVEEETMVHGTQQNNDTVIWHVDRLDQYNLPLDNVYQPNGTGEGVDIYIVDSGINYDHEEFENRAEYGGFDSVIGPYESEDQRGRDCNGHGTHVASLAAGKTYGTAKKARIYSIRVLDCSNRGSISSIIAAADYISGIIPLRGRPAVVSMSLSSSRYSYTIDMAVRRLHDEGIIMVAAAGNDRSDACSISPSSSSKLITVAGSNKEDGMYSFTNAGSCVDIFAPGERITAAGYRCATCTTTMSGTSMSTPKVSGIAAIHLEHDPDLTPDEMKERLIYTAAPDVLNFSSLHSIYRSTTPNRLLYIGPEVSIDCQEPTDIANGTVLFSTLEPGSIATYTCLQGFVMVGEENRTCNFLGKWSGSEPRCIRVCPRLTYPDNGYWYGYYGDTAVEGTIIYYYCYYGYHLKGSETRVCQSDGTWSGVEPTCTLECPRLYPISNGGMTVPLERTVGSVVTYICNDGYELVGPSNRTCIQSSYRDMTYAYWSDYEPHCVRILPAPEVHAFCSAIVWYVSFQCDEITGYDVMFYHPESLHHTSIRHIEPNGTFYIISPLDNLTDTIIYEIYVKVRLESARLKGKWSEGIPLGCVRPSEPNTYTEETTRPETHGVYFELNGEVYLNNSAVSIADIGEGDRALLCKTDKQDCCRTPPHRYGEFYYPDGRKVHINSVIGPFYRNRGEQVIRLNRRKDTTRPTGRYRCEIPTANGEMANIYVTLTAA